MAIKVKKKQSRREAAKTPDTIYTRGESIFNWLEAHRRAVFISMGAALLFIAVFTTVANHAAHSGTEAGSVVLEAAMTANAPVGADAQGPQTYPTEEARAQAVETALAEPLRANPPAPAAELMDATAAMALNDNSKAKDEFEAVARREDLPLMSAVGMQGSAAAQAEAGDLEAAEATLERLGALSDALGDFAMLEEAQLNEAAGQLARAQTLYQQVAAQTQTSLPEGASGGHSLNDIASHRARVLAILTGQAEGTGALPAEEEGTGTPE